MTDAPTPSSASPRPIVIFGPTAGGKSDFAVELALRLPQPGQILSADSMQVYRRMDAGTAKPSLDLRRRVVHHLIDIAEPTERFTVADWLALAEPLIADLQAGGRTPIVVGGTNLYLKALLEGMFEAPEGDPAIRAALDQLPNPTLHEQLRAVDPASAERIHPNDRRKMIRALEVFQATGKPISAWQQQWSDFGTSTTPAAGGASARPPGSKNPPAYRGNPILIGLDWPVEEINPRINARVKQMFYPPPQVPALLLGGPTAESLPDEVRRLEQAGFLGPQAREALGYKQVLEHLAGRCTLAEAFEQTKILTRRFAKSQRTWLKRFRGVHWLPAPGKTPAELSSLALEVVANIGT